LKEQRGFAMADFSTERLDPTSRVTLEHQQDQRDQDAATRRRVPKRPPPKVEPEEPADDEPSHELDQMA
jgi:hypothetical protein